MSSVIFLMVFTHFYVGSIVLNCFYIARVSCSFDTICPRLGVILWFTAKIAIARPMLVVK